jgi:hypothetical protein
MRRELANRETKEMIKLIAISIIAIILYLCFSFSNAYGYQVGNLDRLNFDNTARIDWSSDSWLTTPDPGIRSVESNIGSTSGGNFNYIQDADDGYPDGNEVCPPVPEPTIMILFGMGLGTLGLYRKFRH